jgi:hypothetical protein
LILIINFLVKKISGEVSIMSMWFYDETEETEGYRELQKEIRGLEKEYLENRKLLRDTEQALRADPDSEYLKAKVLYLKKRIKDLENKPPRLSSDVPLEYALWGPPHG